MAASLTRPAQLAETLRQEIQTGRLVPGQKLMSIQDLSQVYQVSVRTVREALALLQQSGYLQCRPRRRALILSGPVPQTAQLIEQTLRQRDQFCDGYRAIQRLLPLLLWQSRLMMNKNEFHDFFRYNRKIVRRKSDHSWQLSSVLFHGLLNYSGNPLFLDLYRVLEQQCLIPIIPGVPHPYEVLARNPQNRDFSLLLQDLQDLHFSALQEKIGRMIENIQKTVSPYLQNLSAAVSDLPEPVFHFHWQTGSAFHTQTKSRLIAQQLILDILNGKLLPDTILPSEKALAAQWNVSVDTLRRSLHYLRQLQFIQTINGKGSLICSPDLNRLNPLTSPEIRQNSLTYLQALQLLCLLCVPAAQDAAATLHAAELEAAVSATLNAPHPPTALLDFLLTHQSSPTMEAILRQVLQLIYAGSPYLYHARKLPGGPVTPNVGCLLNQALDALRQSQIPAYAQSIYQCFLLLFRESRAFLIQTGVSEAQRLQLPDTLPLTVFSKTHPEFREFPNSLSDAKIRQRS
ncbi:GntR family transcriptional regulator [Holdemania massiliensis]|uniref:GntR family transcriptional regulator n=1 Tax=Holdemania massiliensis TaxID=1468449 RepID=UPI0024323FF0|nr:GntR family transcriptional regulator [Holdemania massiliensis]